MESTNQAPPMFYDDGPKLIDRHPSLIVALVLAGAGAFTFAVLLLAPDHASRNRDRIQHCLDIGGVVHADSAGYLTSCEYGRNR